MSPPSDNRYDRRIEEIERELKRVQKTMREVESGRRKLPAAPDPGSSPPRTFSWRSTPDASRETAASSGAAQAPAQGDLFQSSLRRGPASATAAPGPDSPSARPLAHYLSSGGFMGSPLRRDQRHQRAKAIFMLIVLALAIYVVWWLWR
jgi:hypothetical protein